MMKKKLLPGLLFICSSIVTIAQPHFEEQGNLRYRDNEVLINPAFVGTAGHYFISTGLLKQWVGMENSPLSKTLQFQMPVLQAGGLGLWLYNETFGQQTNTQLGMAYAYNLRINDYSDLAIGFNCSLLTMNENRITKLNDPSDPVFSDPLTHQTGFNAGFGAYYFTDACYVGISIPQLLTNSIISSGREPGLVNNFDFNKLQYYFIGGYRFETGKKISLTPSVLVETSKQTSLGYEFMLTAAYDRRIELGAGWAAHSCWQLDFGLTFLKNISLHYRYAQQTGSNYGKHLNSHSIVLRFKWGRTSLKQANTQPEEYNFPENPGIPQ